MNDNHSGFMPAQWQASKAPRIYRRVCTTPNYVNTQTCAANNQRTIDPANPGVFSPAACNGNIVSGSGSIINGISTDGIPGQKEGTTCSSPASAGRRASGSHGTSAGDGKTALRASTGIFYNFRRVEQRAGLHLCLRRRLPGVMHPASIRWGTFQDIANAASGGTTFVESPTNGVVGGLSIPNGHSYNANVAFQRDLGFNTVAEVAWVGNWVYSPGQNVDQNRLPLYVFGNVDNLFNGTTASVNSLRAVYGNYPGMGSVNQFIPDLLTRFWITTRCS